MKELEQDLLKKVKNSDKSAFHQLFSNFYDTLFRFVVYKVKDSDFAEDISQETFLRVWKRYFLEVFYGPNRVICFNKVNISLYHLIQSSFRVHSPGNQFKPLTF